MGNMFINGVPYGGGAQYRELTQAEYDVLSVAEKMNGTMYFITDGQNEGGDAFFYPVIYSEEEREIGVWKNNKPLYAKTIDCGALPDNAGKNVAHNISDIDEICNCAGVANVSNTSFAPLPFVSTTSTNCVAISADKTNVIVQTGSNRSTWNGYVTLYYTKTADTPGSGKYNTLGVPNVHYSTDEQIVGTWIDGNTLYEKTYAGAIDSTISIVQNINLISINGGITDNNGDYYVPFGWYNGQSKVMAHQSNNGQLSIINGTDRTKYILTIQYTKTSP